MVAGAVIAPGYGGSSDQPIVVAMARRLEALGVVTRRVAFTRTRPGGDLGPEMEDVQRLRDALARELADDLRTSGDGDSGSTAKGAAGNSARDQVGSTGTSAAGSGASDNPIALVGRSFGGRVCTRLAVLEPPRALVLLGHPIAPPRRPRPLDEAALEAVSCPTLIVQGDKDSLGPLAVLERIARANRQLTLYVLPGVGHQFGARRNDGLDHAAAWLVERLKQPNAR